MEVVEGSVYIAGRDGASRDGTVRGGHAEGSELGANDERWASHRLSNAVVSQRQVYRDSLRTLLLHCTANIRINPIKLDTGT